MPDSRKIKAHIDIFFMKHPKLKRIFKRQKSKAALLEIIRLERKLASMELSAEHANYKILEDRIERSEKYAEATLAQIKTYRTALFKLTRIKNSSWDDSLQAIKHDGIRKAEKMAKDALGIPDKKRKGVKMCPYPSKKCRWERLAKEK